MCRSCSGGPSWGWIKGVVVMIALTIALLVCHGCTTVPTLLVEVEHTSHPLVGWPLHKQHTDGYNVEDDLTVASALLHWQGESWYLDAGMGGNLLGTNGGGMYGPTLTGTVRGGKEFQLFGRK